MRGRVHLTTSVFVCLTLMDGPTAGAQTAAIQGMVENAESATLTIGGEAVTLLDGGHFRHQLTLEEPAYVKLKAGEEIDLFIEPDDSLVLMIDAQELYGSMQITGEGEELNRFILRETIAAIDWMRFVGENIESIARRDETGYVSLVDSITTLFADRLVAFTESGVDVNEDFVRTELAVLRYARAKGLLDYTHLHRHFSGVSEVELSSGFYDFLDSLDYNDSSLLMVPEYRSFLDAYVDLRAGGLLVGEEDFAPKTYRHFRAKFRVASNTFTDEKVRNEMLHAIIQPLLDEYYLKDVDDLLQEYRESCTDAAYLEDFEEALAYDQEVRDSCEVVVYKTIDGMSLDAFIYRPKDIEAGEARPGLAFFHGGGWSLGKPHWGDWQCRKLASRGMVCISFEYRLITQHDVTPVECIADAKSAIRWMRQQAHQLGIDKDRIVASGFSAGGHIATCTVMLDRFDEPHEDPGISSAANALILWVTPVMLLPGANFEHRLRGRASVAACDPAQHIRPGLPPSIIFQGTEDNEVPCWTVEKFAREMQKAGNRCQLHLYEGQTHLGWGANAQDVLRKMDEFLVSLGYLEE